MRIFLLFLCLFLSLTGCYAQLQNLTKETQNLKTHYLWDFGQVKEGEILKHNFVLKNESNKTLNIKNVSTSCDCTVSEVQKKTLLPAKTTLIEVQFNTKGYSGLTQQFIYVYTDNPDNPILKFTIKADAVK